MRLFLAVDCAQQHKAFTTLQETISVKDATYTSQFHLTLKFLGETTTQELNQIQRALEGLRFAPFELHFDHLGYFSHNKTRQIIWAGVQRKHKIKALQQEIDKRLALVRKPQKKFLPHVTLARIKNNHQKGVQHLFAVAKPILPFTVHVSSIQLIQSTITPTGPLYKEIQEYKAMK